MKSSVSELESFEYNLITIFETQGTVAPHNVDKMQELISSWDYKLNFNVMFYGSFVKMPIV